MSDTPRTDAKWHEVSEDLPFTLAASDPAAGLGEIVPADFARTLERDLAEAVRLLEGLNRCLSNPPEGFMEQMADQKRRVEWYGVMMPHRNAARAFLTSLKERT